MALAISAIIALALSVGPAVGTAAAAVANQTPPRITTNAWENQTLDLTQGTYSGIAPVIASDEWYRCTDPSGADAGCTDTTVNAQSYTLTSADDGFYMKVVETADDLDLSTTTADSNVTFAVQPSAPTSTPPPGIDDTTSNSSTVTQGDALVAMDGTWSEPPDSFSRQWEQCDGSNPCTPISGATVATYTPVRGDVGDTIELVETAVYGPTTVDAASSPTSSVIGQPPQNLSPPTVSPSSAAVGQTLTGDPGTWSNAPSGYLYQWLRCDLQCVAIDGATGQTYSVTGADTGYALKLRADAFVGAIAHTTADSAPLLPPVPSDTTAPQITGGHMQGDRLTADPGSWTRDPGNRYVYQWQRCDGSGGGCTAIAGATAATYDTTAGDVGHTLLAAINGVNSGGTGSAALSQPSALILTSSTTTLDAAPSAPTTNTPVTLTATVTSAAPGVPPDGTVQFTSGGSPIAGCAAQPLAGTGQAQTATCRTAFAAGSPQLAAAFSPSATSLVGGSSSRAIGLAVGRDTTTTNLDATATVQQKHSTTFTATVAAAHSGAVAIAGTVTFMDGGKRIAGCGARAVIGGAATCTVTYAATGRHSIRARFGGDANFRSSSSSVRTVTVAKPPKLPIKGKISATMQWTFHYTPSYTEVLAMAINGVPRGGVVETRCSGRGCPFATRSTTVGTPRKCTKKAKKACPAAGHVALGGPFRHRRLRVGAQITVTIERPQYVGKYYNFLVRARRQPRVRIACLAAGGSRPGVGC